MSLAQIEFDRLPCGYMAVDADGRVLASNALLRHWLGGGAPRTGPEKLDQVLTPASALYYLLSLVPALQLSRQMNEVFLTLRADSETEMSVLASLSRRADSGVVDWALMPAEQRGRWEAEILRSRQIAERESEESRRKSEELLAAKKELERVLSELKESNWLLKKAAEVLPTCMYCGDVKSEGNQWDSALAYLRKNEVFLSHGCCPNCLPQMRKAMGLSPVDGGQ